MLSFDVCNAARLRRDARYDGRFFTAVRTTRIYCRPVCPVKHPLTRNVTYYPTAAAAEAAGYRPCLRCRPETAPFCPAWNGTRSTVARALKLIDGGALEQGSVAALAEKLGVTSRHLARLFERHVGASPQQVANHPPRPARQAATRYHRRYDDRDCLPCGFRQRSPLQRRVLRSLRPLTI